METLKETKKAIIACSLFSPICQPLNEHKVFGKHDFPELKISKRNRLTPSMEGAAFTFDFDGAKVKAVLP